MCVYGQASLSASPISNPRVYSGLVSTRMSAWSRSGWPTKRIIIDVAATLDVGAPLLVVAQQAQ